MGGASSKDVLYAVPLPGTATKDSTAIYRSPDAVSELVTNFPERTIDNAWELFQFGLQVRPDNPCLGTRTVNADGSLGDYEWITYREVEDLAICSGSGLLSLNAVPQVEFCQETYQTTYRCLGLFAKNRKEWIICEQACNAYSIVLVPIYDTLGDEACIFILGQTGMRTVAASSECGDKLLDILIRHNKRKTETNPQSPDEDPKARTTAYSSIRLELLVMFDDVSEAAQAKAAEVNIKLMGWKDLISEGTLHRHPPSPPNPYTINTICYTSGTTGNPKGVLLSNKNFVCAVAGLRAGPFSRPDMRLSEEDVHISYLPLAHVFERIVTNFVFTLSARIGFYSGDTMKLMDDIRRLMPTVFVSVPRLFNRIDDKVFSGIQDKGAFARCLFSQGLKSKLSRMHETSSTTHSIWDSLVFSKTRSLLGDRVKYMISGSAPLDPKVRDHMQALFCVPVLEGFGLTETMGGTFICWPGDVVPSHVGGVVPAVEFKAISVPEMDYHANDTTRREDNPAGLPRGELCLRGGCVSPGYFRNPEETASVYDADGWLHTGDVVMILPNGGVKIIDRKKNIFKLAQGEYVAPEKVENVYRQAPLISQIFVFGYSSEVCLVGIVVPDAEAVHRWFSKHSDEATEPPSLETLCSDLKLKQAMMEEMSVAGKSAGLKGFEVVKDIFLTPEAFSVENNLLTPTFKLKRHFAKNVFKEQISSMYAALKKKG